MAEQHNHAELIKAWADGADIMFYCIERREWYPVEHPSWNPKTFYSLAKPGKHPHAEVIKAWADGAEIEVKDITRTEWARATAPRWHLAHEYRVAQKTE